MTNKGTIKILKEYSWGCPTIWDVKLPDGTDGYVKFRYGYISLRYEGYKGGEIIGEQISDNLHGVISITEITRWLIEKGYKVEL